MYLHACSGAIITNTEHSPNRCGITVVFFLFTSSRNAKRCLDTIKRVIKEYYDRITKLEDQKFDLEYLVKKKDFEVRRRFVQLLDHKQQYAYHPLYCYTILIYCTEHGRAGLNAFRN